WMSVSRNLHPETRLIHAGTLRSQFGETSEALFLTQGFVYDSAEQCEARFIGSEPGYLYSRFSNPTVKMFESRMAAFEGAGGARAGRSDRDWQGGRTQRGNWPSESRRPCHRRQGTIWLVSLGGGGIPAAIRRRLDARRRARSRRMATSRTAEHQGLFSRKPD